MPVPDGLDLDAWVVPSQQKRLQDDEVDAVRKVKKNKKGKGKETSGVRVKGSKRRLKDDELTESPTVVEAEIETPEEIAEREKVRCF